jgi:hypothetical protein
MRRNNTVGPLKFLWYSILVGLFIMFLSSLGGG